VPLDRIFNTKASVEVEQVGAAAHQHMLAIVQRPAARHILKA
jgi:hypothetical protein